MVEEVPLHGVEIGFPLGAVRQLLHSLLPLPQCWHSPVVVTLVHVGKSPTMAAAVALPERRSRTSGIAFERFVQSDGLRVLAAEVGEFRGEPALLERRAQARAKRYAIERTKEAIAIHEFGGFEGGGNRFGPCTFGGCGGHRTARAGAGLSSYQSLASCLGPVLASHLDSHFLIRPDQPETFCAPSPLRRSQRHI